MTALNWFLISAAGFRSCLECRCLLVPENGTPPLSGADDSPSFVPQAVALFQLRLVPVLAEKMDICPVFHPGTPFTTGSGGRTVSTDQPGCSSASVWAQSAIR